MGELDKVMLGERVLVEGVSLKNGSRCHGGFNVIVDGVYVIDYRIVYGTRVLYD